MQKTQPVIIARLSLLKTIPVVAIFMAVTVFGLWNGWKHGDGEGYLMGAVGLCIWMPVAYQLIFHRARGLWLADGELIWISKFAVWEKADEILGVGVSRRTGLRRSLVLRTRSRGPVSIPAFTLAGNLADIRARLLAALGLPDTTEPIHHGDLRG